ncbi:hypothetical protein ACIP29_37245 [Streptomyces coelicoflavus]|uniref:hypothetical protein n=1 Tax=Streptomyces coelicoflavus TaxID=285562 RepID=UPI003822F765
MTREQALQEAVEAAEAGKRLAASAERAAHGGGDPQRYAVAGGVWADTARAYTALAAVLPVLRPASQPECAVCGVTDINLVRAAAAGWRLVLGRPACAFCAGRFPDWTCRQF